MDSKYKVYVIGMRVEKYIGVEADNDCGTQPCTDEKYILFCVAELPYRSRRKFTITLSNEGGWCGSGYTTATWGKMKIEEVENFGPLTHRPKNGRPIQIENAYYTLEEGIYFTKPNAKDEEIYSWNECDYFDVDVLNNIFSYSSDGGDTYYPCGYASVNMNLFTEYKRAFEKRPVWIFTGESATGKTTLGYYLSEEKEVFEIDAQPDCILPDLIWADVIVVGNKHHIDISDILSRLPECTEPIIVNFSKFKEVK